MRQLSDVERLSASAAFIFQSKNAEVKMPSQDWIGHQHGPDHLSSKPVLGPSGETLAWIVDDFLRGDILLKLDPLFSQDGVWQNSYGVFRGEGDAACTYEDWLAAEPQMRFYHFKNLSGAPPDRPLASGYLHWVKFKSLLQSDWFTNALRQLTGVGDELEAMVTGMILEHGHFLKFHTDAKPRRRLCGVFYASEQWRQEYGGEFEMRFGGETVASIPPRRNRLLLFFPDVHQTHRIAPLTPEAAGWRRCSSTIWWSARES